MLLRLELTHCFSTTSKLSFRCKAKASELPTDCAVCGLKLVLAPHLARSFHHLFPVTPFNEIAEQIEVSDNPGFNSTTEKSTVPNKVPSSLQLPPIVTSSSSSSILNPEKVSSIGFKQQNMVKEIKIDSSILFNSRDCDRCCFSCLKVIGVHLIEEKNTKKRKSKQISRQSNDSSSLRFQCPQCKNVFCADCDSFLHETLHNCPGCLTN